MYRTTIIADPMDFALREEELIRQICLFRPELEGTALAVKRTEKGKPFIIFADGGQPVPDVYVSVSHSGGLWACVVSDCVCGLDLQELRPVAAERLAERFFTEAEGRYIKEAGLAGFYELWTRREALAKYTGLGFFGMSERRPELVDEAGRPACSVVWDGLSAVFEELPAPEGFIAVWCHEEANGGKI